VYNDGLVEQVVIYRSPVIPHRTLGLPGAPAGHAIIHGFPERTGGVSVGARRSLNLGVRWGDDAEAVAQNRGIVAREAGFALADLQVTKHVHGTAVWRVGEEMGAPSEYDGMVTDQLGPVLGAFAADCMPVIFVDPTAGVIGACHAGWRGAAAGIGRRIVERMALLGAQPGDLRAAIGPSIGPCCFEVGEEVVDAFRQAYGDLPGMVVAGPRKPHLDLRLAFAAGLMRAGLRADAIDAAPPCTKCHPERFFSYRRDGQAGGVHMGYIGMRPAGAT